MPRKKILNAAEGVLPDVATPAEWLHQTFFNCPLTGQRQRIIDVRAAESGLKCLEIITVGPRSQGEERTAWRHRIYSVEMCPVEELKKAKQRDKKV